MQYRNVSELRKELSRFARDGIPGEGVIVMRNGHPIGVLMNIEEYRALKALAAMAVQDPAGFAEAQKAHERVRQGDLSGFEDLPGLNNGGQQ